MDAQTLQKVALSVAAAQSLPETLRTIVDGLFAIPKVALARIWLLGPGDLCATCLMRPECADQTECLHLAASAGAPLTGPTHAWDRLDGEHCRFPIGARKVGKIASTRKPLLLLEDDGTCWLASTQWAASEQIQCFAGHPLVFRDEFLGVMALFSRDRLDEEALVVLRTFADQAAVAIANARAFDEIASLRDKLKLERDYLREESRQGETLIGSSAALRVPMEHVERVAPTDANVLILGESGTGKELFARAIHEQSARRDRPLVRVNCAAIPKELFESEFFGHKKGSFTGAISDRAGRFEIAHQGTLFLDEVGEIPLDLQSKLLRVLQEGQFERIGDAETRTVDVRIIAATNRDLKREAAEGRFREDLYYRLSVFPIQLPPLRERIDDIGPLAEHFIETATCRLCRERPKLEPAQLRALQAYSWPGNIRELQSVIERAAILSDGHRLPLEAALPELRGNVLARAPAPGAGFVTDEEMRRRERDNIVAALEHADWKVYGDEGAAGLLGLKGSTLASRMRSLGIEKSKD